MRHSTTAKPDRTSVFAEYTLRAAKRDHLRDKLQADGISTAVHYPSPLHLQSALKYCGHQAGDLPVGERAPLEVVSLSISAYLSTLDQDRMIHGITKIASLLKSS